MPEVGELVEDDVVADVGRDLHEAPVEGDAAACGARAPAGALVSDVDGGRGEPVGRGEDMDPVGELGGGEVPEGAFDGDAEVVLLGVRGGDGEVAEEEVGAVRGADDGGGDAPEPDGEAESPFVGRERAQGTADEARLHP